MRVNLPLLLLLLSVLAGAGCRSTKTMTVEGRHLHTARGERVVLRGVNEMFIWSRDRRGETILPEIAKTGANACRLVWTTRGTVEDLDALITNCLRNQMIPMVELHDATGKWDQLQTCLDYWKRPDVKAVMDKHRRWVLLNIANEAGTRTPDSLYSAYYRDAVSQLRGAGYTVPLVIDAANWGQDENNVIHTWREIWNADPLRRCLFSVHTYWSENAQVRLDRLIDSIVTAEIPFLFGEAPQPRVGRDCSTEFPYGSFLTQCQENAIGWLVWSWGAMNNGDCGSPDSAFDITTDGQYGHWEHPWNRDVVVEHAASLERTAVRPKSLRKAGQGTRGQGTGGPGTKDRGAGD